VLPHARWYETAEALFSTEELDFVDICTPPSSHAGLIRGAFARGFHVLCEKPLVGSPAELWTLAQLATSGKRVLHTVHNWHHAPIVHRTRELVRQGAIGHVSHVTWQTLRTKPAATQDARRGNWRLDPAVAGGGVLADHGWHVFYILQSWIGERPTAVSATLETRRHTWAAVEDTATVRLTFPTATADVLLTWAAEVRDNWAELTGSAGTIRLEDDTLILRKGGAEERWTIPPALSGGSVHPDWFDEVARHFVSEVRDGSPARENLIEAGTCVLIGSAARESSLHGGRAIALSA
jgi:predicted dehydrogenase